MTERFWLEGTISVEAALQGASREVYGLYYRVTEKKRQQRRLQRLQNMAEAAGVPVHQVDDAFLTTKAEGNSHGGVLAEVSARSFLTLADLIPQDRPGFVVMLDGIEDPFNFGQAVRALYAAGVDGIVLRPRNWMQATAVVARASAGATERVAMAVVEEAAAAATFFRQRGYRIAATSEKGAQTIYDADLTTSLFLLLGGEKRGITRSFLKKADVLLRVPYGRPFPYALGTAMSAAVIGFELLRQRAAAG